MSDTRIDIIGYSELDEDGAPPTIQPRGSDAVKNANHTPPRSVRVPDELWDAVKKTANRRGESVSDATNRFYARYVMSHAKSEAEETGTPLEEILRRLGA